MTKQKLQQELQEKVKEGIKPSHLKRSKSLGDIPSASLPQQSNLTELQAQLTTTQEKLTNLQNSLGNQDPTLLRKAREELITPTTNQSFSWFSIKT